MAKTKDILLGDGTQIPIIHEDSAVLAIDKPAGWMLAPVWWDRTGRNLQRAIESCLHGGEFWCRSRHLRFLRHIHRLDADTSGVLLLAKSPGVLRIFSQMFETRKVEKSYLAVVEGAPKTGEWVCSWPIGQDPSRRNAMKINGTEPREALTRCRVLEVGPTSSLVLAQPLTGRTHQIRVHLAAAGHPVLGDPLYGKSPGRQTPNNLALRAVKLGYEDPFKRKRVLIEASSQAFLSLWGFSSASGKAMA